MAKSNSIKGGLVWSFGERIISQLVSTIVTIILARLLAPEHYGMVSIVTVFITLCNVFVTSGMGSAIVRKKEVDESDYNTAFFISLAIALALYAVLFVTAPYIASFYKMEGLTAVLRVMALCLPIASMNTIQQARVQRAMSFKRFFIATLFGTVISGIVGVSMAYAGLGVWALVGQYMTNTTVNTVILIFMDKWVPKLQFSFERAKGIYSFGWKVLVTDLVSTLQNDLRSLIIGKAFGPEELAFFDQGKRYPQLIVNNINVAINKVMLPAYSRTQDDLNKMKGLLRKSISGGIFVLAPVLIGMAALSDSFVRVVLTEKWMLCSPYIQIFCVMYLTRPLETSCHQALLALGESGRVLKIMVIINVFGLLTLIIATVVFHSVFLIAIGTLFSTMVSVVCFMVSASKLIRYTLKEQLGDILPGLSISIVMGAAVYFVGLLPINALALLAIQVLIGAIVYIALSALFKVSAYQYFLHVLKARVQKNAA